MVAHVIVSFTLKANIPLYRHTPHFAYRFCGEGGQLGRFHILAIVTNRCTNTSSRPCLQLSGAYPGVELLDHLVILFHVFLGCVVLCTI